MECDQVVPIEEPIEVVVVGHEVTLESSSELPFSSNANINPSESQHGEEQGKNQRTGNIVDRLADIQKQMSKETMTESETGSDIQKEVKEVTKRFRDKMKKRILRKDSEFRKKESEKAKTRMANRRNDPNYREMERQKDRERRAMARQNTAVREREREKDRNYKKKCRDLYTKQVGTYKVGTCDTNGCNRKCAIAGSSGDCGKSGNMVDEMDTENTGFGKTGNVGHCELESLNSVSNSVVYRLVENEYSVDNHSVDQTVEIQECESQEVVLFSSADAVSSQGEVVAITSQGEVDNSELTTKVTSHTDKRIEEADSDRTAIQRTSGYEVCVDNSGDKQDGRVELEDLDHVTVQDFTELLAEHVAQIKSQTKHEGLSVTLYSND